MQLGGVVATWGHKMRYWKAGVGCLGQAAYYWKSFPPGWAVSMHLIPHVEASNANPALDLKMLN